MTIKNWFTRFLSKLLQKPQPSKLPNHLSARYQLEAYNSPHYIQLADGFECVTPKRPPHDLHMYARRLYCYKTKRWLRNIDRVRKLPDALPYLTFEDLVAIGYLRHHPRSKERVLYVVNTEFIRNNIREKRNGKTD